MAKLNCIAIDDEPLALDIIEDYIKKIDFLNLIKKCYRATDAIEIIQKENIDLIFLDIQMPGITGVQLAKSIKNIPPVIFTTAYSNYAVEGFELDAVDYLVKPFTFERFLKAVNKAYELHKLKNKKQISNNFIFVKSEYKNIKVNFKDILFIEGLSDYIKIHLTNGEKILSLQSLKAFFEKLPQNDFIRIHRSYIISIDKIKSIQKNRVFIGETELSVGESYKNEFINKIVNYN
ncbi:MAG: response regulator transcription factor [Chlorobi bacterium]|nr:response regulator transcription factor [Chlorobiota bacterium]